MCKRAAFRAASLVVLAIATTVALVAACGSTTEPLDNSLVRIELFDPPEALPGLDVEVREVDRVRTFTLADFVVNGVGRLEVPDFAVASTGTLIVAVSLQDEEQLIASGEISIALRADFGWDVLVDRGPEDMCASAPCGSVASFPIDPEFQESPNERLWIHWGGLPKGFIN